MKYYVIQECINKRNYQKGRSWIQLINWTPPQFVSVLSQDLDFLCRDILLWCEMILFALLILVEINVREYRRGNQICLCTLRRIPMKYYVILECKNKSNYQKERAWIPLINWTPPHVGPVSSQDLDFQGLISWSFLCSMIWGVRWFC
jgi:hypothetical protein